MSAASRLFAAVEAGDLEAARRLVEEDPSIAAARGDDGVSIVLFARYRSHSEILDLLLSAAPELDIYEAAAVADEDHLKELITTDRDLVHGRSADGWTPLHLASFFGNTEAARLLIGSGADVNARSGNAMENLPLHAAAAGGHEEIAKLLLSARAEVNARQHGGWTALHSAAQQGNRSLATILIGSGADVSIENDDGETPDVTAANAGHQDLAEFLRGPTSLP